MKSKNVISNVAIVAVVVIFAIICACTGSIMNPVGTLWSLFPPVVAIGLALITKEVYSSLFIGVVVGGLLANGFNPVHTMDTIVSDGIISAVSGSAGIFAFLVILGIIAAIAIPAIGTIMKNSEKDAIIFNRSD